MHRVVSPGRWRYSVHGRRRAEVDRDHDALVVHVSPPPQRRAIDVPSRNYSATASRARCASPTVGGAAPSRDRRRNAAVAVGTSRALSPVMISACLIPIDFSDTAAGRRRLWVRSGGATRRPGDPVERLFVGHGRHARRGVRADGRGAATRCRAERTPTCSRWREARARAPARSNASRSKGWRRDVICALRRARARRSDRHGDPRPSRAVACCCSDRSPSTCCVTAPCPVLTIGRASVQAASVAAL